MRLPVFCLGVVLGGVLYIASMGWAVANSTPAMQIVAPYVLLQDMQTGLVLYEKNADEPTPPASLTKLMTALLIFDALEEGRIDLETRFPVSWRSWEAGSGQAGHATMFLSVGERVRVEDLLRGMLVSSGNDAAVALAEGLYGNEDNFVREMNWRAARIKMRRTHFANASGLHDPEQYSTARDLAKLASVLIRDYPQYYKMFSQLWSEWGNVRQKNRIDFLENKTAGVDGLKTGYTKASGYNIVLSTQQRNGRRLVLVLNGASSHELRMREARRLLQWGFDNFQWRKLVDANMSLFRAPVWHGRHADVGLTTAMPVYTLFAKHVDASKLSAHIVYDAPLQAPIEKGQVLGRLVISGPALADQNSLLLADSHVPLDHMGQRIYKSLLALWRRIWLHG